MKQFVFYGSSDDLIEIEAGDVAQPGQPDSPRQPDPPEVRAFAEIECNPGGKGPFEFVLWSPSEQKGVLVVAVFTTLGTWTFAPGLVDDMLDAPDWGLMFRRGVERNDYTLELKLYTPDDVLLIDRQPRDEEVEDNDAILALGIAAIPEHIGEGGVVKYGEVPA